MRRRDLTFFLVALLAAAFATIKVSDSDLWWHLAGGRLLWQGSFPTQNTFSHTNTTYPWMYTQWLFGLVIYGVERLGGIAGVEVIQVLAVAAAFTLALVTAWFWGSRPSVLLLAPLFVLALAASRFRFVPRPHLVTFVGLSLLLGLWAGKPRQLPLYCGILGAIWGNCHAGAAFGTLLLTGILVASVLERKKEELRLSLAGWVAFVLGSLCNPNFLYPYLYAFGHLSVNKIVPLEEFQRASLNGNTSFFVYAGLVLAAIPFKLRRRDFLFPILAAMFFPLALDSIRVIPKFILVTLPGLCQSAGTLWVWLVPRRRGPAIAAAALGLLSAVVFPLAARDFLGQQRLFPCGWGENSRLLPAGAVRYVQQKAIDGRMYNDFESGGYLAWVLYPGRLVFQDGRVQAYPPEFFQEVFGGHGKGAWPSIMERYAVDYAIVTRHHLSYGIDMGTFFEGMGWPLVYLDGVSAVYVKPGSVNEARARGDGFRMISSGDTAESLFARAKKAPAAMLGELGRIRPETLLDPYDFYRFAAAAYGARNPVLAEGYLRAGLGQNPDNLDLRLNMGQLFLRMGRRREAGEAFQRVASEGKGTKMGAEALEQLKALGSAEP